MTPHRILWTNALSTAATATLMLAARGALHPLFGLDTPRLLDATAALFLLYAGALVIAASRPEVSRAALMAFAFTDAAYVAASAVVLVLFWTQIPPVGRALVFAVALVVEVFAILQFRAARVSRIADSRDHQIARAGY